MHISFIYYYIDDILLKGGKIINKKFITIIVVILFLSIFFIILPCSANNTIYESKKIDSLDKGSSCLTSTFITRNRPFPPLMWTEDFETFFIHTPYPNNRPIFYQIDWGDDTSSGWIGPFDSCETVEISHIWNKEGNYTIEVKSKNWFGASKVSVYYLQLLSDMNFFYPIIGYDYLTYKFIFDFIEEEDEEDLFFEILWWDGTIYEWIGSYNGVNIISLSWTAPGKYGFRIRAKNVYNEIIIDWISFKITILPLNNNAPNKPIIIGPPIGRIGVMYCFSFVTFDLDGDEVFYEIDWGDGTPAEVFGPYSSGKIIKKNYEWSEEGIYTVKCKAKDIYYEESYWTVNYVNVPRNSATSNSCWFNLIDIFPTLQILLDWVSDSLL